MDLEVVTDIAQLLDDIGVTLGVDVACIEGCRVVVVVEGGLVGAHVRLVEEEEALDLSWAAWYSDTHTGRRNDLFLFAARGESDHSHEEAQ